MTDPRNAQPGSSATSGRDAEAGGEPRVGAAPGKASVWPGRPDAASPAGWFPPPAGDAAPPVRSREPARSDGPAARGGPPPSGPQPGYVTEPRPPAMRRRPAELADRGWAARTPDMRWPGPRGQGPRHFPVVGPIEAVGSPRDTSPTATATATDGLGLAGGTAAGQGHPPAAARDAGPAVRGRPGGPGLNVPPGAVHGLLGQERQSGWQRAQRIWQDSGVEWEDAPAGWPAGPDRYDPATDPYAAAAYTSAPYPADSYPADSYPADPYPADPYPVDPDADGTSDDRDQPGPGKAGPYPPIRYAAAPVASAFARERPAAGRSTASPDDDWWYRHQGDDQDQAGPGDGLDDEAEHGRAAWPEGDDLAGAWPASDGLAAAVGPAEAGRGAVSLEMPGPDQAGPDQFGFDQAGPAGTGPDWGAPSARAHRAMGGRAAGAELTDPHPTRPDLRVIPVSASSLPGPGPWPVQSSAEDDARAADEDAAARTPLPRRRPGATWNEFPPADFNGLPWPEGPKAAPRPAAFTAERSGADSPPPAFSASPPFAARGFSGPRGLVGARSFAAPPLAAPVAAAPPLASGASRAAGAAYNTGSPLLDETDALFRAWQGSVREASGRRGPRAGGSAGRRGRGWQAVKIGVPAVVIVTVGAGALLMLTGRANEMLAERSGPGPTSSAAPGTSASLSPAGSVLGGYPGDHGPVAVAALWSASGLTVAVGNADGHPAVWRRAPDGAWSLVSAHVLGNLPGQLTSVAQGPLGWIAVGSVRRNGTVEPMAYQSADGVTWTPLPALTALAGNSAQFLGVAAGPGGYLVVGRQGTGGQASAAFWWSGDLRGWTNGGDSGNTGSIATAAVPLGNGFAAVGEEMSCHTIWVSPDGRQWTAHDLSKPAGAQSATLVSVTANAAGRIVAAGYATKNGTSLPIVVTSADGGAHHPQVVLSAPQGPASVTAVTATGDGFVAVGVAGPKSAPRAVTWTSKDGLTWSAAAPLTAAGSSEVTALTDTGAAAPASPGSPSGATSPSTVTGTAQHGASAALLAIPAP